MKWSLYCSKVPETHKVCPSKTLGCARYRIAFVPLNAWCISALLVKSCKKANANLRFRQPHTAAMARMIFCSWCSLFLPRLFVELIRNAKHGIPSKDVLRRLDVVVGIDGAGYCIDLFQRGKRPVRAELGLGLPLDRLLTCSSAALCSACKGLKLFD